jgi:hypothetical protein
MSALDCRQAQQRAGYAEIQQEPRCLGSEIMVLRLCRAHRRLFAFAAECRSEKDP